ncbi:hypothetical protein PHLCEN_2v8786 [Hermanssonia centrifuga]|uniref:Uncharacterized protein n=1 Tax=Hermanssonia centrifuga TaxID=98765 RepID=A0A2R6NSI9_9APHY|nr:hypothetical protein PHLCEN_2v8786 [Hermanssonia centrifuga]
MGVNIAELNLRAVLMCLFSSIEHLARFRKKQAKVVNAGKQKMENAVSNVRHTFSKSDEGDETWKKEVLQGRKTHPTSNDGVQQYADERQNGGTSGVAHSTGPSVPLEQTDFPANISGADLQRGGG